MLLLIGEVKGLRPILDTETDREGVLSDAKANLSSADPEREAEEELQPR